jgi:hypothetical protein
MMQAYVKRMWIYTFRFWLLQLGLHVIGSLYLAFVGNLWEQLLNPAIWVGCFISLPMWALCLTAGALSAFGGRIWLLCVVLQISMNLALVKDSADHLEAYTQLKSYLSKNAH